MKWRFWEKDEPTNDLDMAVGSDAWKDEKDLLSERDLSGYYPEMDEEEPEYYDEDDGP